MTYFRTTGVVYIPWTGHQPVTGQALRWGVFNKLPAAVDSLIIAKLTLLPRTVRYTLYTTATAVTAPHT